MDTQIEKLQKEDLREAAEVFYKSFRSVGEEWEIEYCVKRLEEYFNNDSCWKASQGGKIVGVLTSKPDNVLNHEELYIDIIAVDPEIHKGGVGSMLLSTAEEYAKENGFAAVWLTASTDLASYFWYLKSGFLESSWKVLYKETKKD